MKNPFILLCLSALSLQPVKAQTIKILFDGSHAETCSNADWIPDADKDDISFSGGPASCCSGTKSDPQRVPTPAQSGITASTAETYWTGALSAWGVDCAKHNYIVESLPYNGRFSYNDNTNAQDLSNYTILVVDEPNIVFTTAEKTALINWIKAGGRLFMISDHTVSDRNNDGWDSPMIWNDFLTNNGVDNNNPFGFSIDLANFSQTTTNIPNLPSDSCLHGPMGSVTEAMWSNGTSMTLDPTKNAAVKGVVYMTGSTAGGNTGVMFAHSRYGKGKVAVMGDSSPPDDGTGNSSCTLYNGYFTDAAGNHQKLIMNATIWLATFDAPLDVHPVASFINDVSFFPNPASYTANLRFRMEQEERVEITIHDLVGREVMKLQNELLMTGENGITFSTEALPAGVYVYRISSATGTSVGKFMVAHP
jgi:hypothetical protein